MEITKEALKLFIQSLPVGSTFAIIGFGSQSEFVTYKQDLRKRSSTKGNFQEIWEYSDDTMGKILSEISQFTANYGGTNILDPLKKVIALDVGNKKRRVFLLTDGEVEDKNQVIDFV